MIVKSEEIYEAAFDDDAFRRLPDLLTKSIGGRSALINWQSRSGSFQALSYNYFTEDWITQYALEWAQKDPWVNAVLQPDQLNKLFLGQRHVPDSMLSNSAMFNDFIRRSGDDTFHCCGIAVSGAWGAGIIGIHRGAKEAAFDHEDLAALQPLVRSLGQVLKLRGELASVRSEAALSAAALDGVGLAVIVAQGNGRVLRANALAETILRRRDGLRLQDGAVMAAPHEVADHFPRALARATAAKQPEGSTVVVGRGADQAPYLVSVTPFVGVPGASAAFIVFRDPDAQNAGLVEQLRTLFGLTNVEAMIAADIGAGASVAEIAARRGVGLSTVRSQLKSIMFKTGCSRQAEVAAIAGALPPI